MTRRYRIQPPHRYRYSDDVTRFLRPRPSWRARSGARQRCVTFDLRIDPLPADRSVSRDAYGNISSYFHVTERHRVLSVVGASVVEVDPPPPGWQDSAAAPALGTGP